MDKIGHLVMTKSLSGNIHRAHKAALLFGSILPDLLVYPHNTIFEGTIPEHYAYEKKMTRWMREGALEQMSLPMCKRLDSAAEVEERLQELHDRYLSQKMCYENDMAYMRQMVSEILNCYAEIFVRKSEFAHFMEWVRKKVGIMTGFVS